MSRITKYVVIGVILSLLIAVIITATLLKSTATNRVVTFIQVVAGILIILLLILGYMFYRNDQQAYTSDSSAVKPLINPDDREIGHPKVSYRIGTFQFQITIDKIFRRL